MHDMTETQALKVYQYHLKARVHEVPEARYRGLVEVGVRTARGIDTKLHYCVLARATWADAIDDAEKMLETIRATQCKDADSTVTSARGSTAFETFMTIFASSRKATSPKLVSTNGGKRPARRAHAPKLAPVASEGTSAGVVELRRHA